MDAVYGGVKTKSFSIIPSIKYKKDDLFLPGLLFVSLWHVQYREHPDVEYACQKV